MATLNTSLADMPWLIQGPDREALSRGVASGTRIAQTGLQRAALADRKMEFEREQAIREAQNEREAKLFPLARTLQEQQVQMQTWKIKDALEDRQARIEDAGIVSFGRNQINNAFKAGKPYESLDILTDLASQLNRITRNSDYQMLREEVSNRLKVIQENEKLKSETLRWGAMAKFYASRADATAAGTDLRTRQENRLQEQFDFKKYVEEKKLPPLARPAYEARVRAILNDVTLMGKPAEVQRKLDELDREFRVQGPAGPATGADNDPLGLFK